MLKLGAGSEGPPLLRAVITTPTGLQQVKPLSRHPSRPGIYEAEITAGDPGNYLLQVEFEEQDKVIRSPETRFMVTHEGREPYRSEMNEELLRKIADETKGDFFTPGEADKLADALVTHQRGTMTLVRHELWDMPLIFLLLVLFLCAEWGYRRWRNLV